MKTTFRYTTLTLAIGLVACTSTSEPVTGTEDAAIVSPSAPQPAPVPSQVRHKAQADMAEAEIASFSSKQYATGAAAPAFIGRALHYQPPMPVDRENYHAFKENKLTLVAEQQVSTFSIDVDTGSYSNVRRFINSGQLPREDAVRVEELINYFNYGYKGPESEKTPFSVYTELAPSPWNSQSKLLHIGLQGYDVPMENLPAANLVFLIDVSGSMNSDKKIGLLKQGFRLLTNQLRAQDTVSIAVYAGASGVVLEPTPGDQKHKILAAIDQLKASGSTNGAAGINLAYQLAAANLNKKGINRVILATDGDFNVGTVNFDALIDLVERKRKQGIALTTLGFGRGNYNDHLMEQLADKGNGNYAYIDNLQEARKVLVEELGSTLKTIAKDVKIQIEFNPERVSSYRLIGYENRALKREDFNNDKIDAGEIGAGHTVTAIYELDMVANSGGRIDPLRYSKRDKKLATATESIFGKEIAFLKLRYKQPGTDTSLLISTPIESADQVTDLAKASEPFKFSAAVAAFGQLLKGGTYLGQFGYDDVIDLGLASKGKDQWGYRAEFINMVRLAKELDSGGNQP